MLIVGLLDTRRSSIDVRGNLLVEGLLLLLLWGVEAHRCRRLDASNRDSLLRAGLVHRELTLPVLTVGRFLRERVGRLHSAVRGRDHGGSIGHARATRREANDRTTGIDEATVT